MPSTSLGDTGNRKVPTKSCSLMRSGLTNTNRWHVAGKSKGEGNRVKEEYSDKEQSEKALKGKRIWAEA